MNNTRPAAQQLPDTIAQQLETLDTSRTYLLLIIIAVFISLNHLDLQRVQICQSVKCGTTCRCPKSDALRIGGTALTIVSLAYFYQLARKNACEANGSSCSANLNEAAALLTLVAVVIRFADSMFNLK